MIDVERTKYERAWDEYAEVWPFVRRPGLEYIGDEWSGNGTGAASSLSDYCALIEQRLVAPHIKQSDTVLEIGVGGGRTASILLKYCAKLICADVSSRMLTAVQSRFNTDRLSFVKLDGFTLDGIGIQSVDVCFSFDTLIHLDPHDIFNYLVRLPRLMRGKRLCIFHHSNILTELGWKSFLSQWQRGVHERSPVILSVMTDEIMKRFLDHVGYEVLVKDTTTVPRDCVWVCRAPPK